MRMGAIIIWLAVSFAACAQQKKVCVGFYNLENLFDTIDNPHTHDNDFLPASKKQYNTQRYQQKLNNLAEVIARLGTEEVPEGAAIVGVCEAENKAVLEELVSTEPLAKRKYKVVHYDSPDRRGIDVGLLYNPKYFKLKSSKNYCLSLSNDTAFRTRDQLVVSGKLLGEEVYFVVAHWSSRRGGQEKSEHKRVAAAQLGRHITDSLLAINSDAKIIYMGDLNDDPNNKSVQEVMLAKPTREEVEPCSQPVAKCEFYNPMYSIHQGGEGTLIWRGTWFLFDQTLLSPGWLKGKGLQYHAAAIYSPDFLKQQEGKYKGYPTRSYAGSLWLGGHSDHFPVYITLAKEK